MSNGAFYQYCVFCIFRTMVFTSLCNTDRNYQNDNNGHSAVSTYRSSIRGILSGVFYRISKGKLICAVLGEVIGTGIIGAIVSYPVMTFIWGREGLSWLFYVPSFICGTLIGGSIAYAFLRKLADNGMLTNIQNMLASKSYSYRSGIISNAFTIAAFGAVAFVVIAFVEKALDLTGVVWGYLPYVSIAGFMLAAVIYLVVKKIGQVKEKDAQVTGAV